MAGVNSLTGSFRKINVSLKKRVDYTSIPDHIRDEINSEIGEAYSTESRIQVILKLLLKYADHDCVKALLGFCQDRILDEISDLEKSYIDEMRKSEEDHPKIPKLSNDLRVSPFYTNEYGMEYIEIPIQDSAGTWWSKWEPIRRWSKENAQ